MSLKLDASLHISSPPLQPADYHSENIILPTYSEPLNLSPLEALPIELKDIIFSYLNDEDMANLLSSSPLIYPSAHFESSLINDFKLTSEKVSPSRRRLIATLLKTTIFTKSRHASSLENVLFDMIAEDEGGGMKWKSILFEGLISLPFIINRYESIFSNHFRESNEPALLLAAMQFGSENVINKMSVDKISSDYYHFVKRNIGKCNVIVFETLSKLIFNDSFLPAKGRLIELCRMSQADFRYFALFKAITELNFDLFKYLFMALGMTDPNLADVGYEICKRGNLKMFQFWENEIGSSLDLDMVSFLNISARWGNHNLFDYLLGNVNILDNDALVEELLGMASINKQPKILSIILDRFPHACSFLKNETLASFLSNIESITVLLDKCFPPTGTDDQSDFDIVSFQSKKDQLFTEIVMRNLYSNNLTKDFLKVALISAVEHDNIPVFDYLFPHYPVEKRIFFYYFAVTSAIHYNSLEIFKYLITNSTKSLGYPFLSIYSPQVLHFCRTMGRLTFIHFLIFENAEHDLHKDAILSMAVKESYYKIVRSILNSPELKITPRLRTRLIATCLSSRKFYMVELMGNTVRFVDLVDITINTALKLNFRGSIAAVKVALRRFPRIYRIINDYRVWMLLGGILGSSHSYFGIPSPSFHAVQRFIFILFSLIFLRYISIDLD